MRTNFILSILISSTLFFTSQGIQGQETSKIDSIANSIILSHKNDSIKVSQLNQLVASHWFEQHTLKTIHRSERIAKKNKNKALIADVYRILGNYYFYNSKLDSAEFFLLKSKELINQKKYPFLGASTRNSLGGLYRKKGNIPKAIETVLESKTILEGIDTLYLAEDKLRKLNSEQLILYNTLANFYNQMGEFDKAIDSYNYAFNKAQWLGANKYAGVILSNKGDVLLNMENYKQALTILTQAKLLKIKGNALKTSVVNTEQNIALALMKLKKYKEALKIIDSTIIYFEKEHIPSRLMESYVIKGEILFEMNKYAEAVIYCEKAKKMAIKNNIFQIEEKASLCLSKAYEGLKKYKKALQNYKLYQKSHDHIYNENNIKRITQLEMQYAFAKENELRELLTINKEKETKATIKILAIGITSLLIISILLYRLYYIRQKANKSLTEKNQKISETLAVNETLLKETHHRVKNNLQIISSLLSMQTRFVKDAKSKEIITDSQNRIRAMSLIHQKLYKENNITGIETKTYFSELINNLSLSYGVDPKKIKMDIHIESIVLDIDTAIPLGLILNEMISNAFKHGISNDNGAFSLEFSQPDENFLLLKIKDNGKGIPENFDWKKTKSYGMKLIQALSHKLKADISFYNDNGLNIEMKINRFTKL